MAISWLPAGAVLVVSGALALSYASYAFAARGRWRQAALAIAAAALVVRGYAASDLSLHAWDERYHALVAKHLIDQPLVPTLYADPVLPYDYRDWYSNHVWLHKPPLTMWIQAASMHLFGVSEISLRLPSVLLAAASVLLTFGIGAAVSSPAVGLLAAAFHAFSGILTELAAGRRASDHVDTLLIFLIEFGIFAALTVQKHRPALAGPVLGIICGLAFLTKSFPGLLLLPIWFLFRWQFLPGGGLLRDLGVATVVAFMIGAPWTLYVMSAFPLEWAHESRYSLRHAVEALETHEGPPWRYVADMPRYFGELVYVPVAFVVVSILKGAADASWRAMLAWIAVPYVLFSVMATKMPAYVMVAAPALFVIQAEFWLALRRWRNDESRVLQKVLLTVVLVAFAVLPARYLLSPTGPLEQRDRNPQWARDLRDLNTIIGARKAVLFNIPTPIEAMFYTPYVAYAYMPAPDQIDMLQDRGYEVYVFESRTPERAPNVRRIQ